MIKAVIYARYSSHNQREESIEGQIRECQDFAVKNDMVIVAEYIDRAISGKTDNRAGFQRMIKDSEKGQFQAVIVYAIDRFARSRYDSAMYKAKLKKNGVKVYYAKQSIPDTPEGIILESVMEGYAEYYSENLSVHIKRGMHENALQCKSTGGGIALGYRIAADKTYEIDPAGAKIVQEIFQRYADGDSATEICHYCNSQGYRTSRGAAFNKNSLRTMLQNDKYIGIYRYNDIAVEGGVPAIISRELFEKVQATFKRNHAARAKTKANADYLLSTKLFCGHCGSNMVGESGTARNGNIYYYYKCSNRKRNHDCQKQIEKKEWLEELVVRHTVATVLVDDQIEAISTRAIEVLEKEAAENSILPALQHSLKDIEKRIKNILDLMEQGIATDSTKERLLELESQKADLNQRIARESMKKPLLSKERIMHWLYSFKGGDINNIEYRRKVIDTLVNSVYVFDTNGGKGRKFVFTFNVSGNNTSTINVSDIACFAPPQFVRKRHVFGHLLYQKQVHFAKRANGNGTQAILFTTFRLYLCPHHTMWITFWLARA